MSPSPRSSQPEPPCSRLLRLQLGFHTRPQFPAGGASGCGSVGTERSLGIQQRFGCSAPTEREIGVSVPGTGMIRTQGPAVGRCNTGRCLCSPKASPGGRERGQGRGQSRQLLPGTAIPGLREEPPHLPRRYPGCQRITANPEGCGAGPSLQALPAPDLGSHGRGHAPGPLCPRSRRVSFPWILPRAAGPGAGSGRELGALECGSSSEPAGKLHRALRAHLHVTEGRRKSSRRKVGQRGRERGKSF